MKKWSKKVMPMQVFSVGSLFRCIAIAISILPALSMAEEKLSKWIDKIYVAAEPAPTVIIGHGCGGFSNHEHEWAQQIQSWGFNAVVMDSFKPRGAFYGTCNKTIVLSGERVQDVYEIADVVSKQPFHAGRIGYVGFSHGGSLALHLANDVKNKSIAAAVAYYPGCSKWHKSIKSLFGDRRSFDHPKIPTVMMLAEKDDWTPAKLCLESVKDDNYEVNIYKNATHGFDMNQPKRQVAGWTLWYDQEADTDSRAKTKGFFEKYLR